LSTLTKLRERLERGGKDYRNAFVAAQLKRGIPFQARALRKQRGWSQEDLARESGLTQGAVSRALDPDYGNLTLNTILKIAAGFDVAFIGKFVPFSELGRWFQGQSEESVQVQSFSGDPGFIPRKDVGRSFTPYTQKGTGDSQQAFNGATFIVADVGSSPKVSSGSAKGNSAIQQLPVYVNHGISDTRAA
jgi:transcriptional regulator with XRE-family HTH domain